MNKLRNILLTGLLLLLLPLAALSGANSWTGTGPFATGAGNRVIGALAVSPDGQTIYAGTGSGTVLSYEIVLPSVTTSAASGTSATGATLNGAVNAQGGSFTPMFRYGTTSGVYPSSVAATPDPVTGSSATTISAILTGLAPNTTYYFRAEATGGSTVQGSELSFTTGKLAPTATTGAATSVTSAAATLNATVNAQHDITTISFQYGLSTSYGSTATASPASLSTSANTAVSAALSGLAASTTYHFRVVATNSTGTTQGANQSFTTPVAAPTTVTSAANGVTTTGATLNGTVNANGNSTTVTFEYGTTATLGTSVAATPATVTGAVSTSVSAALIGLLPNTTYYFKVSGTNAGGTAGGGTLSFTTPLTAPVASASTAISPTGFSANWGAVTGATQYWLDVATDSGFGSMVAGYSNKDVGNATTAAVTGLASGTTYHYRVRAYNGTSSSASSNTISATTGASRTVTNTNDSGPGSLRQTLADANPGDTVTFAAGVTGTITLATTLPITKDLTITGPGAAVLAVSGNNAVRVLSIDSGVTLNWSDLTVANGKYVTPSSGTLTAPGGGGLVNYGTLSLQNCAFNGNATVGEHPGYGVLGGAINNVLGTVTIHNCTFSGNSATHSVSAMAGMGGAIANLATMAVTNSTFANNTAQSHGGGLYSTGTLDVTNATIAGNSVSDASGTGGGIGIASGTTSLKNTLVANNTATASGPDIAGAITSQGYNLFGSTAGATIGGDTTGNLTNGAPLLGALANNGGATQTLALLAGSPAIDAGTCTGAPATDQRGTARPQNGSCDIGAYEATLSFVSVTPSSSGNGSISPSTVQSLSHGATTSFTLTPNAGYHIASVGGTCGGSLSGSTFTTAAVTADCTVVASFALNAYAVTVSAGVGGSASCTPNPVSHGGSSTCTASPGAGYSFNAWSGDCSGASCTLSNVTSTRSVSASFLANSATTYAITVSAGTGGTASCTPNPVSHGGSSTCTATPGAGYSFNAWSGDCSGASCTLSNVTGTRSVTASFLADSTKTYTAPSATGTGNITARLSGGGTQCGFNVRQYIPLTGHAASPPAGSAPKGVSFPHGLFDFTTVNCTPGSTITLVVTYPQTLPAGTVYWKYGPTPSDASYHWYQLPASIAGNIATFSITDGSLGDDDLLANGTVIDQGGPGGGAAAVSIPTLSEWALLVLAGLMGLFGLGAMRRISA